MSRIFSLKSDLGDALLFSHMDAGERLGALYDYRLVALSRDAGLDLVKLLGSPMAVHMSYPGGGERWFHGIVIEAAQTGTVEVEGVSYVTYALALAPRLWLLTQRRNSRIFANRKVPDIVREVLSGIGYSDISVKLSGDYPVREYCVQYREDDFSFISRLMEQEGIYYYFKHDDSKHTLVLADGLGAHAPAPGAASLPYLAAGMEGHREGVSDWGPLSRLHTTVCRLTDYDPLNPRTSLMSRADAGQGVPLHKVDGLEVFDFPGGFLNHASPGTSSDAEEVRRYAQVKVDAQNAERACCRGRSHAVGLAVGSLFKLSESPGSQWDSEYLVTGCTMQLRCLPSLRRHDHTANSPWPSHAAAAAFLACAVRATPRRW